MMTLPIGGLLALHRQEGFLVLLSIEVHELLAAFLHHLEALFLLTQEVPVLGRVATRGAVPVAAARGRTPSADTAASARPATSSSAPASAAAATTASATTTCAGVIRRYQANGEYGNRESEQASNLFQHGIRLSVRTRNRWDGMGAYETPCP